MKNFNATTQQKDILSTIQSGKDTCVQALAGTGKTSTLVYVSNALPNKRILYLAFNKANAEEAKERFGNNVTCQTVHSVAYQAICKGTSYGRRLQNFYDYRGITDLIGKLSGSSERDIVSNFVNISIDMLKKFCASDYTDISQIGVEYPEYNVEKMAYYLAGASKLWETMSNKDSSVKITHDIYFKLFQLSPLDLGYDIVMLDEAQDSNPATVSILLSQTDSQKVLVGDKYQSIYAWRGARNAMDAVPEFETKYLTESFRFPQSIADKANILLKAMGSPVTLTGLGKGVNTGDTSATLVRSNANLFQAMLSNAVEGNSIYVEADLKELWSQMYTMNAMKFGRNGGTIEWPKFPDKQTASYGTWESLCENAPSELRKVVKLVERGNGHKEISTIKCALVEDKDKAKEIICTGHKSKGLEFSRVVVQSDFLPYKYDEGVDDTKWANYVAEQGANLLYVAFTRAMEELLLDDDVEAFLKLVEKDFT